MGRVKLFSDLEMGTAYTVYGKEGTYDSCLLKVRDEKRDTKFLLHPKFYLNDYVECTFNPEFPLKFMVRQYDGVKVPIILTDKLMWINMN